MFCPECGAKNEENAKFCEKCGTRLNENTAAYAETQIPNQVPNPMPEYGTQMQQKPHNPLSGSAKIIIAEVVVLVIAAIVFYKVGMSHYSSEETAKQHFIKEMNGDWGSVYDDFDLKEDDFINKKAFIQANKNTQLVKCSNFRVKNGITGGSKDGALINNVTISYTESGANEESDETLSLTKQKEKRMLFFDSWKVSPADYICKDFMIYVPSGAKVVLNNKEIKDLYLSKSDSSEDMDCYRIPKIFNGLYDIKITKENMEDATGQVNTTDGYFELDSMNVKNELLEKAANQAGEDWNQLVASLVQQKSFQNVSDLFKDSDAQSDYMDELSDFSDYDVQSVTVGKMTPTVSYEESDGSIYISVDLDYEYKMFYMETDFWDGSSYKNSYNSTLTSGLKYVLDGESLKLTSVNYGFYLY